MNDKFNAPTLGDTVNHVAPNSQKITKVKVIEVSQAHEGRLVTVEVPTKKTNADGDEVNSLAKVTVPFRPKEKLAGNTWHFALIALLLSLALSVWAGLPSYHTYSATGNGTTSAYVIFPADPNSQIRLVNFMYRNDTNICNIVLSSGTTAYSLTWTNVSTTAVTNVINSTNGLTIGTALILQHAASGVDYTNYVLNYGNSGTASWTNANGFVLTNTTTTYGAYGQGPVGFPATNVSWVAIGTGGWGVLALTSDEIYLMANVTSIPCGATNTVNSINGDDIFSGDYGRPVEAQLSIANTTNNIYSASAHYDSASQP